MSSIYLITPVFNEEQNMTSLIEGWKKLGDKFSTYMLNFILVDDGSTDNTVQKAREEGKNLQLTVLEQGTNKGPGFAFASGFKHISSLISAGDIVVTMEGDNTSRLETLEVMIGRIEREGVEVALASPYAYGGGISNTNSFRKFISYVANKMVKIIFGIYGIFTFSSFFRAMKAETVKELQAKYGPEIIESPGFECMIELLKKIIIQEHSISEVPMVVDTSRRAGKSKMKIIKTIRGYFRLFLIASKWK